MKQEEIIKGFEQLGVLMTSLGENKDWENFSVGVTESEYLSLQTVINRQVSYNGWFTKENVRGSLLNLGSQLNSNSVSNWSSSYTFNDDPKKYLKSSAKIVEIYVKIKVNISKKIIFYFYIMVRGKFNFEAKVQWSTNWFRKVLLF